MEIYPGDSYPVEYYEQVYGPMLKDNSVSPEVKEKLKQLIEDARKRDEELM